MITRAGKSVTSALRLCLGRWPPGPHGTGGMLVMIGATPEGKKELIGFQVGVRESAQSWHELLVDLKARGLAIAPELAVADGALGFWKALDEVFPGTRHQRCWFHKVGNLLNKVAKSIQPKQDLREIWMASRRRSMPSASSKRSTAPSTPAPSSA